MKKYTARGYRNGSLVTVTGVFTGRLDSTTARGVVKAVRGNGVVNVFSVILEDDFNRSVYQGLSSLG